LLSLLAARFPETEAMVEGFLAVNKRGRAQSYFVLQALSSSSPQIF